jgi:hypothetical protein
MLLNPGGRSCSIWRITFPLGTADANRNQERENVEAEDRAHLSLVMVKEKS